MTTDAKLQTKVHLFVDESKESELGLKYLREQKFEVIPYNRDIKKIKEWLYHNRYSITPIFSNSNKEPLIPTLLVDSECVDRFEMFSSFSGVKSFLREKIQERLFGEFKHYWKDVKTFYPMGHSVTCFDRNNRVIFMGDIKESPYNLEKPLGEHDFSDWHDVSGWKIGSLDELVKKQNEEGIIIDEKTKSVIFPDEIPILKKGKRVTIVDERCYMAVTYTGYFHDNGIIYGLYAHMFD